MVPNDDAKLVLVDKSKNLSVPVRKLPALDLRIKLTQAYPLKQAPFVWVESPFYLQYAQ